MLGLLNRFNNGKDVIKYLFMQRIILLFWAPPRDLTQEQCLRLPNMKNFRYIHRMEIAFGGKEFGSKLDWYNFLHSITNLASSNVGLPAAVNTGCKPEAAILSPFLL